jgi:plasmid stabilization system protein ParE
LDKRKVIKPVYWTERATKDLQKITAFNVELLGADKARSIAFEIANVVLILENPDFNYLDIGAIDESLGYLKKKYRKLIHGHYKINYREGADRIFINKVFDTRQHPRKNK